MLLDSRLNFQRAAGVVNQPFIGFRRLPDQRHTPGRQSSNPPASQLARLPKYAPLYPAYVISPRMGVPAQRHHASRACTRIASRAGDLDDTG